MSETDNAPRVETERVDDPDLQIHERPSITHILWWIIGVLAAIIIVEQTIFNANWRWDIIAGYMFDGRILNGVLTTIQLTVLSSAIGLLIGALVAAARLSKHRVPRVLAGIYIWVARAVPTLVMLLFVFFIGALIPTVSIGIPFTDINLVEIDMDDIVTRASAAVAGLAFFLGGMSAEIFRSGLMAVPKGQLEAAQAIGMSKRTSFRVIVAPQATRVALPPLANEMITMFKNTSLVTVIGYMDLLGTVQQIYATTFETIPLLTVAVIWYLALTSLALWGQSALEKRLGRGF